MKILGIDVGGSGIKGAIVDTEIGELITERFRIPTPQPPTPEAMIQTICEIIEHFEWHGQIGVGFPAAVRSEIIKTASNIDKSWIGLNAAEKIKVATGCNTHLVNDVDAAGLAEIKFGAGKGAEGVTLMVAAGTGIGTGLFIGSQLVPNTELGFVWLNDMPGEHYAANSVREKEDLSWTVWGMRFNEYLKRLESLFWPDLFIIGGGVSKHFDKYSACFTLDTQVVPAQSKNHAGIIGAALAAKQSGALHE
ncbi:MAG: ROK family protein [Cyclobacteriaceae bacterium]